MPDTFMDMCMRHEVGDKGTPQEQAVAICSSMQEKWGSSAKGWHKYKAMKKAEDRKAKQRAAFPDGGGRDIQVEGGFLPTLQSP